MYVTDVNQSTGAQWKATTGNNDINPDSTTDGAANHANVTVAINTLPAINLCETLSRHGQTDWYLPAHDELEVLYGNRVAINASAGENFALNTCWSSSESSTGVSCHLNFTYGTKACVLNKANSQYVRCVRRH